MFSILGDPSDPWSTLPVKKLVALYDYDPQELSPNVDAEVIIFTVLIFRSTNLFKISIKKCNLYFCMEHYVINCKCFFE